MNEYNIIVSGVGGQGVLFLTGIIAKTALRLKKNFIQSEVHGLAQRYGSIHTELRIGEDVKSPLVLEGKLDLLISLEPLEALRYANYVNERTNIVLNTHVVPSQAAYLDKISIPSLDKIVEALQSLKPKMIYGVKATEIALRVGDPIVTNTVMLGALSGLSLLPFTSEEVRETLSLETRREYRDINLKAFDAGLREAFRM